MAENRYGKTTKRVSAARGGNSSAKSTAKKAAGIGAAVVTAKAITRAHPKTVAAVIITFILSLALGVGACFFLNRNDEFEMLGEEYVTLEIGEGYADEGVKIVEFGRDISDKAQVETSMRYENGKYYAEGEETAYYISYTVNTLKFGKIYPVKKIRIVTFVEPTEEDAIAAAGD